MAPCIPAKRSPSARCPVDAVESHPDSTSMRIIPSEKVVLGTRSVTGASCRRHARFQAAAAAVPTGCSARIS
jgi:hypothetical protein